MPFAAHNHYNIQQQHMGPPFVTSHPYSIQEEQQLYNSQMSQPLAAYQPHANQRQQMAVHFSADNPYGQMYPLVQFQGQNLQPFQDSELYDILQLGTRMLQMQSA